MPATKKTAAKKPAAPNKPGVKKTQAKTAAIVKAVVKNITEPKTATKKTSATKSTSKPATKATSLSKSTSKTTPATKTVVTELSVSGNKKIKSLETEFDTVFGLYAQVCYTAADGHRYYTSGSADDKTLSAFNAECEKNGCKKGAWK